MEKLDGSKISQLRSDDGGNSSLTAVNSSKADDANETSARSFDERSRVIVAQQVIAHGPRTEQVVVAIPLSDMGQLAADSVQVASAAAAAAVLKVDQVEASTSKVTKFSGAAESDSRSSQDIAEEATATTSRRQAKERRRSLKEQESFERVQEYLAKACSYPPQDNQQQQPTSSSPDKGSSSSISPTVEVTVKELPSPIMAVELQEVESPSEETPPTQRLPSSLMKRKASTPDQEVNNKKGVTIRDDIEEIYYEVQQDEQVSELPELRLVTARIITAEEAAATMIEETSNNRAVVVAPAPRIVLSPTEQQQPKSILTSASSKVAQDDNSHLQLASLSKSTSENTLVVAEEQHRVSEKNISADIMMDLSKVSEDVEAESESSLEVPDKRPLTRTGSEGSKRHLARVAARLPSVDKTAPGDPKSGDEKRLTSLEEDPPDRHHPPLTQAHSFRY